MNILIIKDQRAKYSVDGTAVYFRNYALELQSRGFKVVALLESTDTQLQDFCVSYGIDFFVIPNHRLIEAKPMRSVINIWRIRKLIRSLVQSMKIDIIDLHHHSLFHLLPKSLSSKIIVHQHGALSEQQIHKSLSYKLFRRSHLEHLKRSLMFRLDIADLIIVASRDAEASTIKQFRCENANFLVSPYGTTGAHSFTRYKQGHTRPKILICSRFTVSKGAIDCLRFSEILERKFPGTFIIEHAGYVDYDDPTIKDALNTINHDIQFLGHVDHISDKMKSYWGMVNLSHREAGGMVLFEAKSASLPVFAWNTVGVREFIKSGANGFLHEKGDFDHLIDNVISCLNDQELYHNLRKNSFQDFEENYHFSNHTDRLIKKFRELEL